MSLSYILYLDAPVTPASLRTVLVEEHGFTVSEGWRTADGTPWLYNAQGAVLIEPPDPDNSGPYDYRQPRTLIIILNQNKQKDADSLLLRLAGDILQRCPGDAVLEWDTGGTILLRRDDVVWVVPDPEYYEDLFSGAYHPAKLIVGLPTPDPAGAAS